ncbi:unnamed protein product, partial [Staurois parvus]
QVIACPLPPSSGLRCYSCSLAHSCKVRKEVECGSDQDTCQRSHIPITAPSGNGRTETTTSPAPARGLWSWSVYVPPTDVRTPQEKNAPQGDRECCKGSLCIT